MLKRRKQHLWLILVLTIIFYAFYDALLRNKGGNDGQTEGVIEHWDDLLKENADRYIEDGGGSPLTEPLDATWQQVQDAQSTFMVYSAFYDGRKQRCVRVICAGRTRMRATDQAWCVLRFNDTTLPRVTRANIKVIREHHNLEYSACFVICPLSADDAVPEAVSVVASLTYPPSNHLVVVDNTAGDAPQGQLAVCVKPVHNYNQSLHLVEFLQLYSLLGAEHFTFFHRNVSAEVHCLANLDERCDWLSWDGLGLKSAVDIRTEGIFAALNDCLYRNMYRYRLVAFVDLDEYIVSRRNETLVQLVDRLDKSGKFGSYVFQNAFFYQTWPSSDVINGDELATRLVTLSKTRRKSKLLQHRNRSKYIARPELTLEVGNHFVWEHLKGIKVLNVKERDALSQHYRAVCEFGGEDCLKEPSEIDENALRYSHNLTDRVRSAMKEVELMCATMPGDYFL